MILEKEKEIALHATGRCSGVLHAGFYYTSDSLKARFTKDGNKAMTNYCNEHNLKINKCGKVVVAKNAKELKVLHTLYERGLANGIDLQMLSPSEIQKNHSNILTYQKALYSPTTSTVNPLEICQKIKTELEDKGVVFKLNEAYLQKFSDNSIITSKKNKIYADKIINCSGLYADKIAKDFNFSKDYTIIPFKGMYLKYIKKDIPVRTNVYPVPDLEQPFLGIHYTLDVHNEIKIGPTAVPALWRENYKGFTNFKINEFSEILKYETILFFKNSFGFRDLVFKEIKKYSKSYFINMAAKMLNNVDKKAFLTWSKPGIRAQLLNTKTLELLQDFVVEGDVHSVHVLNAVSPAFTCSFPFATWVVDNYIETTKDKG